MRDQQTSTQVAGRLAVFSTLAACCALLAEYILLSQVDIGYFGFVGFFMLTGVVLWFGFFAFAKRYQTEWFDRVTSDQKNLQLQASFSALCPWPILRFDRYGQLISKNSSAKTFFYTVEFNPGAQRSIFDFFPELTKADWQKIVNEELLYQVEYTRGGFWLTFYFRAHQQLGVINVYGYDVTKYKRRQSSFQDAQKTALEHVSQVNEFLHVTLSVLYQPAKNVHQRLHEMVKPESHDLVRDVQALVDVILRIEDLFELTSSSGKRQAHSFDCRLVSERLIASFGKLARASEIELISDCDFSRLQQAKTDGVRLQQALAALLRFGVSRSNRNGTVFFKIRWLGGGLGQIEVNENSKAFFQVVVHDSGVYDERIVQMLTSKDELKFQDHCQDLAELDIWFLKLLAPLVGAQIFARVSPLGGHEISVLWPVEIVDSQKNECTTEVLSDYSVLVYDEVELCAEAVAKTLARSGAAVQVFSKQDTLICAIQRSAPHVVVCGMHHDRCFDGELFDHIKAINEQPVGVCLLVHADEDLTDHQFNDLNVDSIVLKPIRSHLLLQGVQHALESSKNKFSLTSAESKRQPASSTTSPRVLVIDDDLVVLHLVADLLTELGVDVEVSESAMSGIKMMSRTRFDLIIMDVRMPLMDGFTATQEIRDSFGDDLPILALTASDNASDRTKALQIGMNDYLVKPVDRDLLIQRLSQWIDLPKVDDATRASHSLVAIDDQTPEIEVREAVKLLNQDLELFMKSLLRFYGCFYREDLTIKKLLESQAAGEILQRLHRLRGGSANIGAYKLRDKIFSFEKVLRSGDITSQASGEVLSLIESLHRVLEEDRFLLQYFMTHLRPVDIHDQVHRSTQAMNTSLQELMGKMNDFVRQREKGDQPIGDEGIGGQNGKRS